MNGELPQLLFGIAAMGYRGSITEHALSSLVAHAKDHGVETVLGWIKDDPGLLLMPSCHYLDQEDCCCGWCLRPKPPSVWLGGEIKIEEEP